MNIYTVMLVPPAGYKQTFKIQADHCVVDHSNGRTFLAFCIKGSNSRTVVIGQGMSYFMSGVDTEGNEVFVP